MIKKSKVKCKDKNKNLSKACVTRKKSKDKDSCYSNFEIIENLKKEQKKNLALKKKIARLKNLIEQYKAEISRSHKSLDYLNLLLNNYNDF